MMTTQDSIIAVFCLVDDHMQEVPKQRQATLYPSELVTIGLLFALKEGHVRALYRWLKRDADALCAGLPDRARSPIRIGTNASWPIRALSW